MKKMWTWLRNQSVSTRSEVLLLGLFFTCFTIGQLGRITMFPTATIYLHDIVIVAWLLSHVSQIPRHLKTAFLWLRQHPLLVTSALWILLGLVWGNIVQFQPRPILILSRLLTYSLFAVSVAAFFHEHRITLRLLLVIVGNLMLWLGLVQYVVLPDTRFLSILGWDDHYFRLIGPLFDPNFMGMLIILTSIYSASIYLLLPRKIQIVLQSYYAGLLALTYSRASYATAGMTALLLASAPHPFRKWGIRHRALLAVATIVAFALVLLVAPKPGGEGVRLLRTSSIVARQATASQSLQNLTTFDLVVGRGLFTNSFSNAGSRESSIPQHAQVPDNILLLLLTGTGIIGTILILSSLIYWIGQLASKETALAIAVAATLLHAQFNNTLFEPFISLFLLLGVFAPLDQNAPIIVPNTRFRAPIKSNNKMKKRRKNYVSR